MFKSDKPYTAVSVHIESLTSEQYEIEDSSGIVDLIEVIRIQSTGPTEASRALRKKLKYGNLHRQLRALTILDFLIQNTGDRFLREFADEPLLERLRIAATDPVSDPEVRKKCQQLFGQWAVTYKDTPGMGGITALYRQLPKRKQPAQQAQAKVLRETAPSAPEAPMGHSVSISVGEGPSTILTSPKTKKSKRSSTFGSSSSKSNKKSGVKPFNMEKEKPEILQTIASASVASTNLQNALKLVNRETRRVSEDEEVITQFERCKSLRRQILRYIQHIESGDLLGSLIHANEELVTGLMAFEVLDKSLDYDSDSEDDQIYQRGIDESFSGITIGPPKPPRPARPMSIPGFPTDNKTSPFNFDDLESASESEEEEDENNPFGDRNEVKTPHVEKHQPTWREV
ncbi:VHS domain protein [Talaromyces stipitatus ATCC 10500]|uniref:VHS domain protein n=1 Tax=Talaromyces stipitatus (strain ATCC 10500 / CBS 375.48 / QM 6759 / NRRL 1006) TaxID=441959 RepID=B8LYP7_TALSN|nr:VHS domain protein [Talaromyces stipitatus ATCC 10500]EED23405.1 VHS domain protein [Talaromyces stipitatus ATCC 10500]